MVDRVGELLAASPWVGCKEPEAATGRAKTSAGLPTARRQKVRKIEPGMRLLPQERAALCFAPEPDAPELLKRDILRSQCPQSRPPHHAAHGQGRERRRRGQGKQECRRASKRSLKPQTRMAGRNEIRGGTGGLRPGRGQSPVRPCSPLYFARTLNAMAGIPPMRLDCKSCLSRRLKADFLPAPP